MKDKAPMFEKVTLRGKGKKIASSLARELAKLKHLDLKKNRIKLVFQRIDSVNNVIRYTSLLYIDSLTPDADKLYQDLKEKEGSPKAFIQLLIVEGIWKALNKKDIFSRPELNLTSENVDEFNNFMKKLEEGNALEELNKKLKDLKKDLTNKRFFTGKLSNNLFKDVWSKYEKAFFA